MSGKLPFSENLSSSIKELAKKAATEVENVHGKAFEPSSRKKILDALAELIGEELIKSKSEAKFFIDSLRVWTYLE